jgi:5'-3' exonuclease
MRCPGAPSVCQTAGMPGDSRPVLLLDSASLYYRAFHALPESMTAPDGRPHNAIRGFLSTLTRLVDQYSPADVVPCWDADWRPQWRVDLIPTYKAHRVAEVADGDEPDAELEPESLGAQADALAELLTAVGIAPLGSPGFEADDVIASVAAQESRPVLAVSGDRDLVQIVDDRVSLLLTVNGGMDKWPVLDPASVVERFGVHPSRYVDMAVLRGDPSDGLPGVAGIGAKTAVALVSAFDGIDGILRAAQEAPGQRPMTPRLAAALLATPDTVLRARTVALAVTDLDVGQTRPAADRATFDRVAEAWGVTRQADALRKSLERQTADE